MPDPWLILETSGRTGLVGVAVGDAVVASRSLDGAKRHNRDLVPTCAELLVETGFTATQLAGVMVGLGPGSYTGLRVGLMAAKGFAMATGCAFVAVPTPPTNWPNVNTPPSSRSDGAKASPNADLAVGEKWSEAPPATPRSMQH